jgi:TPR repeat protein
MQFKTRISSAALSLFLMLTGCGTYLFSSEDYALGSRMLDRKNCQYALKYLEPMAEAGDCDAEYKMGLMYLTSTCKELDEALGVSFLTRAAKKGQPKAEILLGNLNYQKENDPEIWPCAGCKIPKDLVEALKWYRLAEINAVYDGEKGFTQKVSSEILPLLSAAQKIEVEKRVQNFSYAPAQCKPRKYL